MSLLSRLLSLFSKESSVSREKAEQTADHLIELGYLKFVAEPDRAAVRSQIVESIQGRFLGTECDEDTGISADGRTYFADAEDLAEGEVGSCIRQMADVLRREGVELEAIEDDFRDQRYYLVINGTANLIHNNPEPVVSWSLAHRRLLEIVNSLLESAGSEERLYALYPADNDGLVMLLTPEMHAYLRSHAEFFDEQWMPRSAEELDSER